MTLWTLRAFTLCLVSMLLLSRPLFAWESPEHLRLGDELPGAKGLLILLQAHDRDFPQRSLPQEQWPTTWKTLHDKGTPDQQRFLRHGLTYGEVVALIGDFYSNFKRTWVHKHSEAVLAQQPLSEKGRWIERLTSGYISDDDGTAVVKICKSVSTLYEKRHLLEKNFRFLFTLDRNIAKAKQSLQTN